MTQIQSNKQDIAEMQNKMKFQLGDFRDISLPTPTRVVTSRWTNDEVMLAIQGTIY